MENDFNKTDFEHFIKQNADQYRMFPSEKLWKGIHNTIHTRRRWYGFGLSFLILTTAVVTWVMLSTSGKNSQVISSLPPLTLHQTIQENKPVTKINLAPVKPANNKLSFVTNAVNPEQDIFLPDNSVNTVDDYISSTNTLTIPTEEINSGATTVLKAETGFVSDHLVAKAPVIPKQVIANEPVALPVVTDKINEINSTAALLSAAKEKENIREELNRNRVGDYSLTIESVINSYKYTRRKKRLALEAYITPSISYRDLKENKPFISWARNQTNGTTNATYAADINSVVKHKPDLGLQVGLTAGLPVTKRVRLLAGLQFNVSKYDIRAYTHASEQTTISLSTAAGGRNTVTATSNYRNVGVGPEPDWLRNLYISGSIPLGIEVRLLGNRRSYFGVSGTMQPTYILSNKSYLLSTDYKNYAKVPSLTRKWNLNAGFEMFAGISTGKLKWRVGPQIRYQVMSSYQERYPIKEHLFDFGLKMGIMLNK